MSVSEADRTVLAAAAALDAAAGASPEAVRAVVSAATRLYAGAVERAGAEIPPVGPEVTTTDALTLSCALLRSQGLTPFDMALWFGRGRSQETA
jgi:hypothetical protein